MKIILYIAACILIGFHAIGFILFQHDVQHAELSWLNIIITASLLIAFEQRKTSVIFALIAIVFGGYIIEAIGINSGLLFGDYVYGEALGPKILNTPPIIGLNWLCIVIASSSLASYLIHKNFVLQAFLAAALAVSMDFIIEPIAIQYKMWAWAGNQIPLSNYITWFIFALFFALIYLNAQKKRNPLGIVVYLLWIFFFIALTFQL